VPIDLTASITKHYGGTSKIKTAIYCPLAIRCCAKTEQLRGFAAGKGKRKVYGNNTNMSANEHCSAKKITYICDNARQS
jgi:hypothetical protein